MKSTPRVERGRSVWSHYETFNAQRRLQHCDELLDCHRLIHDWPKLVELVKRWHQDMHPRPVFPSTTSYAVPEGVPPEMAAP